MATPKLRFKEFESNWVTQSLSNFTNRVVRKNKANICQLPLTISAQYGLVDQTEFFNKTIASKNLEGYYLVENGEFAYNKSYSTGYPFGAIKRLDNYNQGVLSTLYICFKPKINTNSDFLTHYFETNKWHTEVSMIAVEGARNHGLLNIPISDFFDTQHTLPSDENEQKKIADFLSLLDRKIALQEKKIALLKDYKKGVLHLIFSKNSDFQYKEIGEFAEVYQPKTISLDDCKYGGDYSVYGANGLIGYYRDYNHELEQVTISCRGENSGTVNFIPPFSWITGNSMVINLDQATNILKKFVCYSLQYENLKSIVSGSGQPQIIRKDVLNFKIKVTNIKKQQEIIECLEKIELKIINQRNKEVALKAIKNSLLQQMFI